MSVLSEIDDVVIDYVASTYSYEINQEILDGMFHSDHTPDRCFVEQYIDMQTNTWLLRVIAGAYSS
tara:strand:+ start:13463 stop:13660 length:198 start_codon:yes stop_codon:yes gene_type:complete